MPTKEEYPKKILSFDNQIERLIGRGLLIPDVEKAKELLRNISYFRLQGYWWEFQADKEIHRFKEGTSFDDIINLYTFDRKLRLILFDAIERVEIALRSKLVYYLSIELDQWWFENKDNFHNHSFFKESLKEIDKELNRTKEVFIKSHYEKYGNKQRPPAYKTLEVISFGCLSKLYSNLKKDITAKERVAKEFDLPNSNYLKSWSISFNIVRNIIAHHSRLWNRNLDFPPRILSKPKSDFINLAENEHSLYHITSCLLYVLNKVSKGHSLKEKIIQLIEDSPYIDLKEMGFPEDWREQSIWK